MNDAMLVSYSRGSFFWAFLMLVELKLKVNLMF